MRRSILLVDSSPTIRKMGEMAFGDTEVRVESAATGTEALARLASLLPQAVLADVSLDAPTGYELCQQIKASQHAVPVLLLVSAFEPLDEERARRCGADGYLTKPFAPAELRETVLQLLATPAAVAPPPPAVAAPPPPTETAEPPPPAELAGFPPEILEALAREVASRVTPPLLREVERMIRERIGEQRRED